MIWRLLEQVLRFEENVKATWASIRNGRGEEEAGAVTEDHGFGTPAYKGMTGAGWAHTRDSEGRIIYVPGDLVDEFVTAEIADEGKDQEVSRLLYGPFSADHMRAIISFARMEHDPDIVLVWIAAHGGLHDDVS